MDIRVKFRQIQQDFNPRDNFILWALRRKYNVILDDINFDYSFGETVKGRISIGILFDPHPNVNNIRDCDYILSQYFVPEDPRFIRMPLYLHYVYDFLRRGDLKSVDYFFNPRNNKDILKEKTGFCNWVCGGPQNGNGQYRDQFVRKLMARKHVDCAGSRFNNMNKIQWLGDAGTENSVIKRKFITNYKFTLSLENNSTIEGYDGYTSEKIIDPMMSNSLPIYWGNKKINEEFNNKSFVNFHDYENEDTVIDKILEIDDNDDMYLEYMNVPLVLKNDYFNVDFLAEQLKIIIES